MTSPFTCPNAKTYTEDNIQDIYCDHNQLAKALVLKGPGVSSLCSVYFSGGRNLALKQKAVLTPDSTNADNTVDGNWWNCEHLQTSITKDTPFIEISFHKTVSISRFRLHNRVYGEDVKSSGVVIDAFDEQSTRLLHYTNESTMQLEFNLNIEKLNRVSKVKITNPNTKSSSFSDFVDNICEIQIFGDCIDGSWGLDCENKCDKKCGNVCHKETGKC
ncbi:uncharacterized protein LOC131934981 [Physella acuta]|uniref:uncharacterized protein LOC131934981 n=1 Tax=Physella acuta TaxID=109671 RepID=UPI0027DBB298|nr:uncharacterized protein LOC131934981 [Physella acuta]XP_059147239.1 uncharacterized protein LOC131934981 [Physella acuta]